MAPGSMLARAPMWADGWTVAVLSILSVNWLVFFRCFCSRGIPGSIDRPAALCSQSRSAPRVGRSPGPSRHLNEGGGGSGVCRGHELRGRARGGEFGREAGSTATVTGRGGSGAVGRPGPADAATGAGPGMHASASLVRQLVVSTTGEGTRFPKRPDANHSNALPVGGRRGATDCTSSSQARSR